MVGGAAGGSGEQSAAADQGDHAVNGLLRGDRCEPVVGGGVEEADLVDLVDGADAGDEVGLVGDQSEHPYAGVVFAQDAGDARGGAGRADAGHEPVRGPSVEVLDDLGPGAGRVCLDVARVEVLVGVEIGAAGPGERLVEAGERVVGVGGVQTLAPAGQFLDLGAEQQEQFLDLGHAHPVGDALELQPVHAGQQGERLGRVAAGEFHDRAVAARRPLQMGACHVPGRAVLDGAEGVEHLQLGVEVDVAQTVHRRVDADERCVADGFRDAVVPHDGTPCGCVSGQ